MSRLARTRHLAGGLSWFRGISRDAAAQRGRTSKSSFRRFMGTRSGRKIVYASPRRSAGSLRGGSTA